MTDDRMQRIVRPDRVPIRTVWAREDLNFTPWLAANLDWLDFLDLGPLTLEGQEVPVPGWNRNLDILASTADGRPVAIENQYLEADHDHLTRGLAYAVGLEAKALVVIAENHRPEFVAVADYLNRAQEQMGDDGIAVFMVNLEVEGVGDFLIPRFTIVARPNAWRTAVHAAGVSNFPSDEAFLDGCAEETRERTTRLVSAWNERPQTSTRPGQKSLALDVRHPFKPGNPVNSIYLLDTTGRLTIYRGYYLDSGAFRSDEERAALDSKIRAHFPEAQWRAKHYYLACDAYEPDEALAFADWLLDHFAQATQDSTQPDRDQESRE